MSEIQQKLLAIFQVEHKEHLEQIRSLLENLEKGAGVRPGPELDEVFRRAHSLKGAARAVSLKPVETLAHRLETLFVRVREGSLRVEPPALAAIHQALDATEDAVASLGEGRSPVDAEAALQALAQVLGPEPEPPPPATEAPRIAGPVQPIGTVRVAAENLDGLLRSAGQLLTESLRQNQLSRRLHELSRRVAKMEQEWDRVRDSSAVSLRRLTGLPEFGRVARYLDFVDEQVRSLASETRLARFEQHRSAWSLRHLGEELGQSIRLVRMAPAESVFEGFRKMLRDLARDEGKQVDFRMEGLEVQADRMVLQALKDPVLHLLRNAVCHGLESPGERVARGKRESGVVTLRVEAHGSRLLVLVEDDGRGIDFPAVAAVAIRKGLLPGGEAAAVPHAELLRFLFQPGFSTLPKVTDLAGRGMGLSVVHEQVRRLQGEVRLEPRPGGGLAAWLLVPLSISTHRLLLLACRGQTFALPVHAIERLCRLRLEQIQTLEGKAVCQHQGQPIPVVALSKLLGLPGEAPPVDGAPLAVMLLRSGEQRVAVVVDAFLTERDALVQELGVPFAQATPATGGMLLEDGAVAVVLDPVRLLETVREFRHASAWKPPAPVEPALAPSILVVDDSITTRALEKSILEAHGYRVRVAVDGLEALTQLRSEKADLVIADIHMPRLDGFGLLEEMKKDERLAKVPVIIVTSMERREDQEKGLALGADAYIVKRKFDQRDLLDTIRQIL
ncbi:MAG: response regulator [Acidobacteria bacterium]|nr:response regulator [Acidobacteriota bacterium]